MVIDCGVKPSQLEKYQNPQIKLNSLKLFASETTPSKNYTSPLLPLFLSRNLEILAPNSLTPNLLNTKIPRSNHSWIRSSLTTNGHWVFCVLDPQGTSQQTPEAGFFAKKVRQSTNRKWIGQQLNFVILLLMDCRGVIMLLNGAPRLMVDKQSIYLVIFIGLQYP